MSQQSSIDARRQWWPDMTYASSRIEITATRMGCNRQKVGDEPDLLILKPRSICSSPEATL